MSALCNVIPHLYYSALFTVCIFLSLYTCAWLTSKHVYLSFYSIRIASLQGNHGYFSFEVINKNKNKIRWSWKIYSILQLSFTLLHFTIHSIVLFTLQNTILKLLNKKKPHREVIEYTFANSHHAQQDARLKDVYCISFLLLLLFINGVKYG